ALMSQSSHAGGPPVAQRHTDLARNAGQRDGRGLLPFGVWAGISLAAPAQAGNRRGAATRRPYHCSVGHTAEHSLGQSNWDSNTVLTHLGKSCSSRQELA